MKKNVNNGTISSESVFEEAISSLKSLQRLLIYRKGQIMEELDGLTEKQKPVSEMSDVEDILERGVNEATAEVLRGKAKATSGALDSISFFLLQIARLQAYGEVGYNVNPDDLKE